MARTRFWYVVETTFTTFHPAQISTLIYRIDYENIQAYQVSVRDKVARSCI